MKAWLLTWNPKYYDPYKEVIGVEEDGRHNMWWSTVCRQMEPGDHLLLMRQGKEPRGIVAGGRVRKSGRDRTVVFHNGRWYVPVMWTWFTPADPVFSLHHLEDLFPDQHWSPRGSGIRIHPPVDEQLVKLIDKAQNERNTNERR